MDLLILVIALAFMRIWGTDNPLHKDIFTIRIMSIFQRWLPSYHAKNVLSGGHPTWRALCDVRVFGLLSVVALSLIILLVLCIIGGVSQWLLFPFSVVLLIYSFGRGNFFDAAFKYAQSCYVEDWQSALEHSQTLGVKTDAIFQKDWQTLHKHVFSRVCLCGFDQLFVVIFYFLLVGPVFVLFYRLLTLQAAKYPSDEATSFVLSVLNWPAVRLLGFSFALVGNFSSCIAQLIPFMRRFNDSACVVISSIALGAFNHDGAVAVTTKVKRKDIELLIQLYRRALWLWFIVVAITVIVF